MERTRDMTVRDITEQEIRRGAYGLFRTTARDRLSERDIRYAWDELDETMRQQLCRTSRAVLEEAAKKEDL
jgi:hypothetical protein